MAQQIPSQPTAGITPSALQAYCACPRRIGRKFRTLVAIALFASAIPHVRGESTASKNKEGNRHYAAGRYAEAERAYLDAQVQSPGKPEVLYNLGNAYIRQNKADQGIHALRQAQSKGNKQVQQHSWYNAGNAWFAKNDFQQASQAYIQALKLNPGDKDAKHNLELALMKLKQPAQPQSASKPPAQNSKGAKDSPPAASDPANAGNQHAPASGDTPSQTHPQPKPGAISKDQALQILDALQSRELEDQRQLRQRSLSRQLKERDW